MLRERLTDAFAYACAFHRDQHQKDSDLWSRIVKRLGDESRQIEKAAAASIALATHNNVSSTETRSGPTRVRVSVFHLPDWPGNVLFIVIGRPSSRQRIFGALATAWRDKTQALECAAAVQRIGAMTGLRSGNGLRFRAARWLARLPLRARMRMRVSGGLVQSPAKIRQ